MAAVKEGPRGRDGNKSNPMIDVTRRLEIAQEIMDDLKDEIREMTGGKVAVDSRDIARKANPGDSLSDLENAIFEQLVFLQDDVRTCEGHTRRLLGWDERAEKEPVDGVKEPEPDDIRAKLRAILGFIGRIRETQCRTNERLAQGI